MVIGVCHVYGSIGLIVGLKAGAVGVGARVSDTIRNKILSTKAFEQEPTILMLGMTCALVGSSTYMTVATKIGLPVSTTHSIVGGVSSE